MSSSAKSIARLDVARGRAQHQRALEEEQVAGVFAERRAVEGGGVRRVLLRVGGARREVGAGERAEIDLLVRRQGKRTRRGRRQQQPSKRGVLA